MAEKENIREPLAPRLLPLLTERMGRLRNEIEVMRASHGHSADLAFLGLDELGEQIDQTGWALGVSCAHGGADVLMERNREDGATLLINCVRELRGKPPLSDALPRLSASCPPLLPYFLAQLVWWGSDQADSPSFLIVGDVLQICGAWAWNDEVPFPVAELQDSRLSLHGNNTWHLEVPASWVHS